MRKFILLYILALFSIGSAIAQTGDFTITGGTLNTQYTYTDNTLTIIQAGDYIINNTHPTNSTTHKIHVNTGLGLAGDTPLNITLKGVKINVSAYDNTSAFNIQGNSVVNLILEVGSNNFLRSGNNRAGLQVESTSTDTATVNISGRGALIAIGSGYSAGIGGYGRGVSGIVTISGSAKVTASGGRGVGIGGGGREHIQEEDYTVGHCGPVTISGSATVTATGGYYGAGIGGGVTGAGGDLTISDSANVIATGGYNAAGIGGGSKNKKTGGTVNISCSAKVTANGGYGGAGIGGGVNGVGCDIIISDYAKVTAKGGTLAAGIGSGWEDDDGGYNGSGNTVTISGSVTVIANGGNAASGIGAGNNNTIHGILNVGDSLLIKAGATAKPDTIVSLAKYRTDRNQFVEILTRYTLMFLVNRTIPIAGDTTFQVVYRNADSVALTKNIFTKKSHTFKGWDTSVNATNIIYHDQDSIKNLSSIINDTIKLYAVWDTNTYTIAFINNGENKRPFSTDTVYQTFSYDSDSVALLANLFSNPAYMFKGWDTSANATNIIYHDQDSIKNLSSINKDTIELYAIWRYYDFTAVSGTNTLYYRIMEPAVGGNLGKATLFSELYHGNAEAEVTLYNTPPTGDLLVPNIVTNNGNQYVVISSGGWGVRHCTGLDGTLTIGDSMRTVGDYVFSHCSYTGTLTIPNYVETIGIQAFCHNPDFIHSLVIGTSVTAIARQAFWACTSIDDIHFLSWDPPNINSSTFSEIRRNIPITVPCGRGDVYKAAQFYGSFTNFYESAYQFTVLAKTVNAHDSISIINNSCIDGTVTFEVHPKEGYEFIQWTDSNTDNPRTINLFKDTTFFGELDSIYTVAFFANDGTDKDTMQRIIFGADSHTLIANSFKREGYTFQGWSTLKSATTVEYDDQDDIKGLCEKRADMVKLYAVWQVNTYSVKFLANGGTGTDTIQNFTYDADSVALLANSFERIGYTFAGWDTNANASNIIYYDQDSIKNLSAINNDTIELYAVWTANTYSIKFLANGGTGAEIIQNFTYDADSVALFANRFEKTGYSFTGWDTNVNATDIIYHDQDSIKNLRAKNNDTIKLYAVWTANTYSIKFLANGGTGAEIIQNFTYDADSVALLANSFEKIGYSFTGWDTNVNATNIVYHDQDSIKNLSAKNNDTIELYAVWTANTYSIKFLANGGTGTEIIQNFTYDADSVALLVNSFEKIGYTFAGWDTSVNANNIIYHDQDSIKNLSAINNDTVNLYAVWQLTPEVNYTMIFNNNGGSGNMPNQIFEIDVSQQLTKCDFSKTGYTFQGWSFTALGAVQLTDEALFTATQDTTLYAVWHPNTYTVIFHANGGEGSMSEQVFIYDEAQYLNHNAYTKAYELFLGWAESADGVVIYGDNEEVLNLNAIDHTIIDLYTVWESKGEQLFFPSAINPDGKNKIFKVIGIPKPDYKYYMAIYNRLGQRLFETHDFHQGWDCTFKGKPVQIGVYIYIFSAINNEDVWEKKGTITIIR